MNRLLVGVIGLLVGGIVAGSAVGQGSGGTVGPSATGTKTFEVRIKQNQIGLNCGNGTVNRCFRRKPRLASVFAGSGAVYDGNTRVGVAVFHSVYARKVKKTTVDTFTATILFDNHVDTITVAGPSSDAFKEALPYSIVGGTGAYAGARGTVIEGKEDDSHRGEFRIPLNLTFIP